MSKEKQFNYYELTKEQQEFLTNLVPEEMFISGETVELVIKELELGGKGEEDLRAIRDSVVKLYSAFKDDRGRTEWDMMTRMSMVTAVIDHELFSKGHQV